MLLRRGAHFTFDAASFAGFVTKLQTEIDISAQSFPTFSHSSKDPVPGGSSIERHHRIMRVHDMINACLITGRNLTMSMAHSIIEGLYSFLNVGSWADAAHALDERIWIDITRSVGKDSCFSHVFVYLSSSRADPP